MYAFLKNLFKYNTNIESLCYNINIRRNTMIKYIQCVQNDNKNVTPQDTIYAIKNAGFNGAFLQWYNKDWEFSQQEQLNLCRKLGLEIYIEPGHGLLERKKGFGYQMTSEQIVDVDLVPYDEYVTYKMLLL